MTEQDIRCILAISFLAADADGTTTDAEREQVRAAATRLAGNGIDVASAYQDVLLKRVDLAGAVARLVAPEARQLAYELAVGVCNVDGAASAAEQAFLADLATRLGLDAGRSGEQAAQAAAIAAAGVPIAASAASAVTPADGTLRSNLGEAELDKLIVDAAILNGALELLPESLATMAIIPLQMRMVYRIGQSYGYPLDQGHIKDFLATLGVGLTSQYIEQIGRKLLGGVLGAIGGGLLGGLGRQAASSGMSFASTWALGQVARRYYAGGRTLSGQMLRESFQQMLGQARDLQGKLLPQMREQARTLNPGRIVEMIRGQ
ncbi:MAG: GTPase [Rhodanobacteraceae bacterium]|nr:GTPase [Rhodanobacteraceae bacterium]